MTILFKKQTLTILIALMCLTVHGQVERKVAVFDPAGRVSDDIKEIVREVISSIVVNTDGYEVLERRLIDRILEENRFQAGGLVDDSQIVEMGRLLGANLAFVSSVTALGGNFFISGKIIDIQTARIERQQTAETQNGTRDLVAVVQRLVGEMLRQPTSSGTPQTPAPTPVVSSPSTPRQPRQQQSPPPRTVSSAPDRQTTVITDMPLVARLGAVYQLNRELSQIEFNNQIGRFAGRKNFSTIYNADVKPLLEISGNSTALEYYKRGNRNINGGALMSIFMGLYNPVGQSLISKGTWQIRETVYMYNASINRTDVSQMMFNYYHNKGKKQNKSGNVLLLSGIGIGVLSGWILPMYVFPHRNSWNEGIGTPCLAIGGAMTYVGIPLKISGKRNMKAPIYIQNIGGAGAGL